VSPPRTRVHASPVVTQMKAKYFLSLVLVTVMYFMLAVMASPSTWT
jgi:hypothetical protein